MKRIGLLAVALATGCVSNAGPGDVAVYWNFSRNTLISPFSVLYDGNLSPGGTGPCTDSGVQYVTVTDPFGALIDPSMPTIPCVYAGVQGASFLSFSPGTYTFVVHGYRTVPGVGTVEVHRGQSSVNVIGGQLNTVTVTAAGLQGDLDVNLDQGGSPFVCVSGDTLDYTLWDTRPGMPTVIDSVVGLACGNVIVFRVGLGTGVDLDGLTTQVKVINSGATVLDSGVTPVFPHFGNDAGGFGWTVNL